MYYPIMLDIKDRSCVVVGGGKVALRKIAELIRCEAAITVVSPELCSELEAKCAEHNIKHIRAEYEKKLLSEADLCFACTDSRDINSIIAEDARELKKYVNVSDNAEQSSFIVPAVRRKGEITLAVTANENPAASRYTADFLAEGLEEWLLEYISMTGGFRRKVKEKLVPSKTRQELMKALFTGEFINTARISAAEAERKANMLLEKIEKKGGFENE